MLVNPVRECYKNVRNGLKSLNGQIAQVAQDGQIELAELGELDFNGVSSVSF